MAGQHFVFAFTVDQLKGCGQAGQQGLRRRAAELAVAQRAAAQPPVPVEARRGVALGHGGGLHKKTPAQVARARQYVTGCGYHVVAIDAPGHGDRPRSPADERARDELRQAMLAGDTEQVSAVSLRYGASLAERAVPEWQATLDALQELPEIGHEAPIGYGGGITLGTGIGSAMVHDGVLVPNSELGHLEIDGYDAEKRAASSIKDKEGLSYEEWATQRLQPYYSHVEMLFSPDLFVTGGGDYHGKVRRSVDSGRFAPKGVVICDTTSTGEAASAFALPSGHSSSRSSE